MKTFLAAALAFGLSATASLATTVGVAGFDQYSSFLNANGETSSSVSLDAASLAGLDTLILNRVSGNQAVIDFVAGGGLLITEWSASAWALNTANLLDADDTGGGFIGTGTNITFNAAGQATNLDDLSGTTYNTVGSATQFFRSFDNIGASVDVLATRPGGEAVILAGTFGLGTVLIMGYDWNDQPYSGTADNGNEQVLLQAIDFAADTPAVPLPAGAPLLIAGIGAFAFLRRRKT